jgi:cytochrome c biogenesis protein CcdA
MLVLSITLAVCFAARFAFVAFHLRDLESMWYDFDRKGLTYHIAWLLSIVTLGAAFAAAAYAIWSLPKTDISWSQRYGTIFVAWLGLALLERFPLHKFPRTNSPLLYRDAQADLITNLIMALASAVGMTILSGIYYWFRGA